MRTTTTATIALPWPLAVTLALASCSAPPKPPTVDESLKRPANSTQAVELQVCRHDLHNTRLLANESGRVAEATHARLANLAARQQILSALQAPAETPALSGSGGAEQAGVEPNRVFSVRFGFGSTVVHVPTDVAPLLIEAARSAPLVVLRGRTDGRTDTLVESRIARERAAAVRDYLVAAGVDPARIRATHQPVGDHVADNVSDGGRALNRRVEIELYRTLPTPLMLPAR